MNRKLLSLFAAAALIPLASWGDHDDDDDDDEHEGRSSRRVKPQQLPGWKAYAAECGSCHVAYPPTMLPARSWTALMGGLADHFGQNAEVDETTRRALEAFLLGNSGRDVAGPTPLRITQLRWWVREHDEVRPEVYKRKAIVSPANCAACHPGANEGAFGEHQVKIPRDAVAPR
jgi:hypothetical protein